MINLELKMKKYLIILISAIILSGCTLSAPTNYEDIAKTLTIGMTKSKVVELLGEPTSKKIDLDGSEEYRYRSEGNQTAKDIGNILLIPTLPLAAIGIVIPGSIKSEYSDLDLTFDKNGFLERFNSNTRAY
ncbi:hypothetical protein A6A21_03675 [Phocoenobacter uteri]|nr:hypothetical protein [Phocoenobacter uteri]